MFINQNTIALNTLNLLMKANAAQSMSMQKLTSGLRINSASDDAVGLAISEKMRAQIRGLDQAQRNIQDANSLIQTAEGGLSNILEPPLQRMRELVIQAANDTLTTDDRAQIQDEINNIVQEVDGIANNTEFNGIKLLNTEKTVTNTTITTAPNQTWKEVPTGSTTNFYSLAWSGNRYLAVGYQGNTLTSQDGVNWNVPSSPVTNVNLNSVK